MKYLARCSILAFCLSLSALAAFTWQKVRERQGVMKRVEIIREHGKTLWWANDAYVKAHHGRYPSAAHWEDELKATLQLNQSQMNELVLCPISESFGGVQRRFALNSALAGQSAAQFDGSFNAVLFFESSNTRPNACDPLSSLAPPQVNGTELMTCIVFVGGWVDRISSRQFVGYPSWAAKQIKIVPDNRGKTVGGI